MQHIAFYTDDIVESVRALRLRGTEFLRVPSAYYGLLEQKLKRYGLTIQEDIALVNTCYSTVRMLSI